MFNIKALAAATAISAGAVFAMPATGQAMPASSPVKAQTANDSNIITVHNRKRMSWSRYCATHDDWRCSRQYGYRTRTYVTPDYYGDPYYGYYRPYRYHYGPGINVGPLRFGLD